MKNQSQKNRNTLNQIQAPRALPFNFALRIILWGSLLLLGILCILSARFSIIALGILLVGLMLVHGVELQHQCLHNTGFATKFSNRLFGTLLGLPMGVSFIAYRESHLWHHRFLGTSKDKEFFVYTRSETLGFSGLLRYSINFKRYPKTFSRIKFLFSNFKKISILEKSEALDYFAFCCLGVATLVVAICLQKIIFAGGAIIGVLMVAEIVHNLVELPEHIGCKRDTRDGLHNTRTIKSNFMMTWFTNSNNFHVEHHKFPGIPLQLMSKIHQELQPEIRYLNSGYLAFFSELLKRDSDARRIFNKAKNESVS